MSPDVQLVAIEFADSTVGVMHFVCEQRDKRGNIAWTRLPTREAVDAEIARSAFDASKLPVKRWQFIEPSALPATRDYRDAWVLQGERITHSMPKARELHRGRIRALRTAQLLELDAKWMRATGQNKKTEADRIEAERQRWRDAPSDPRIDAAQTIEELKAVVHA